MAPLPGIQPQLTVLRGAGRDSDYLGRWAASRSHPMRYTVFACGVFYERFAPGGLAAYNLGAGPGGGPRVSVLTADGLTPVDDFFGFEPTFQGGVTVG